LRNRFDFQERDRLRSNEDWDPAYYNQREVNKRMAMSVGYSAIYSATYSVIYHCQLLRHCRKGGSGDGVQIERHANRIAADGNLTKETLITIIAEDIH